MQADQLISKERYLVIESENLSLRESLKTDEFNAQAQHLPDLAFASGEKERKMLDDQFIYDQLAHPEKYSEIHLDRIVNTLERDAIQSKFNINRDEINAKFDAQIKNLSDRVDSKTVVMESHLENFTQLKSDLDKSNIKLSSAIDENAAREKSLKELQARLGSTKDIKIELNAAEKSLTGAKKEGEVARKSIVDIYESKIKGAEALAPTEKTGWREKLAEGLSSVGANRLSNKILDTKESRLLDQKHVDSHDNRQTEIMELAIALKASNPKLSSRLSDQSKFEISTYDIKNLKESVAVGLASSDVKLRLEHLERERSVRATEMARSDQNVSTRDYVASALDNISSEIGGHDNELSHDELKKLSNSLSSIDNEFSAQENVSQIKANSGLVSEAEKYRDKGAEKVILETINNEMKEKLTKNAGSLVDSVERSINTDLKSIKNLETAKDATPGFASAQVRLAILKASTETGKQKIKDYTDKKAEVSQSKKLQ